MAISGGAVMGHANCLTRHESNLYELPYSESELKQGFTKQDIKETYILFRDFCVNEKIPDDITTLSELLRWRSKAIERAIAEWEHDTIVEPKRGRPKGQTKPKPKSDRPRGRPKFSNSKIPDAFYEHLPKFQRGAVNKTEFSRLCGLSMPTVRKYLLYAS